MDRVLEVKGKVEEELSTEDQRLYKNSTFWNHLVFLSASVIGTFYFPPMFFLHLIIIIARIEKLGTILKAAVYNIKSLLYMAALGFVFTYIFSTVTFSNYMKDLYSTDTEPAEMCDKVVDCVTSLYIGGVVGEGGEEFELTRFSYDMISFIFWDIMFGSIVSSLMLDAFGSLREEQDTRQNDKENKCYICEV